MRQYKDEAIKLLNPKTPIVPNARAGMPATRVCDSIQLRFDLDRDSGFPILTTKHVSFKNIITELFWFLRGSSNIRYLVEKGVNIWNENAYNYAKRVVKDLSKNYNVNSIEDFIELVKQRKLADPRHVDSTITKNGSYVFGDLGYVYGDYWRNYQHRKDAFINSKGNLEYFIDSVDQVGNLIKNVIKEPYSRYHVVDSWDPVCNLRTAQPSCHGYFKLNVKPIGLKDRLVLLMERIGDELIDKVGDDVIVSGENVTLSKLLSMKDAKARNKYLKEVNELFDMYSIPKDRFTLNVVQRSADYFIGVPYNITSYALLAYILGYLTNTIPANMIWTGLDTHIYEPHIPQLSEQIHREHYPLPELEIRVNDVWIPFKQFRLVYAGYTTNIDDFLTLYTEDDFRLVNYQHGSKLKGELFVGTVKEAK